MHADQHIFCLQLSQVFLSSGPNRPFKQSFTNLEINQVGVIISFCFTVGDNLFNGREY